MPASAASPRVRILGFAGHLGKGTNAPADAVESGRTWGSCRIADLKELYVFIAYSGFRKGAKVAVRWSLGGKPVFTYRVTWTGRPSGHDDYYVNRNGGKDQLPDGRWGAEISVAGKVLASGTVRRVTRYC